MKPTVKLLILEDNENDILALKEMLGEIDAGELTDVTFEAVFLESLGRGIRCLQSTPVDLILLDLALPDSLGLHTLRALREAKGAGDIPIVVLTALDSKEVGLRAVQMGAQEYLVKNDITPRVLATSLRYAIERHQLNRQWQKETENLARSESLFIEIITNTPDGVVIVDTAKRIHFMNPAAEMLLDCKNLEMEGKVLPYPLVSDESEALAIDIPQGNNETVTVDMRGVKIDWQGTDAWLLSLRDITRKKKLLKEFQEEKEQLEITLRSIADGVIAVDEKGVIRIMNWMAGQLTGWPRENAVGKSLAEVLKLKSKTTGQLLNITAAALATTATTATTAATSTTSTTSTTAAAAATAPPAPTTPTARVTEVKAFRSMESSAAEDWVLIARNGIDIPVEYSCAPIFKEEEMIGRVLVIRDVSEKRELEQEMVRAQNLEALGNLAAGIAHQYSNILTATLGYISLVKMLVGDDHKSFPRLVKAEEAGLRAKEISYRLFTFAKGGEPQKEPGDIVKTLKKVVSDTLDKKYPGIIVDWEISPDLWPLSYDCQQVNSAVRNILKNAVEAMEQTGDRQGRITIRIENMTPPEIKFYNVKHGNYVKVIITDQGIGIPEENLPWIFDPYFSTKEKGEGMGLTTAYSIIRKHGGGVRVKSKKNEGTAVTLLFPTAVTLQEQKTPGGAILTEPREVVPATPKKKKILVMDDEELVREIAREMLEFLEYETFFTESGDEALEQYRWAREAGNPFDGIILDLMIPGGMGGKDCLKSILDIDPQAKAIVSSGYSDDPVIVKYRDYGFRGVLAKPYKLHELEEVLEKLWEEGEKNA